ncbi:macrophage mannose receptor 1-like [Saccoglossus kowalevskii]|uniref:Macrophage mannose receptor 1-like n=1 Tax=Saccoglossus kowalevskii TaxID=10224 RepID=A0ABM0GJ40_SACKO|nr:PREDICTED: macrophage mannose receptor 1-like [Saccoglossus kowalevskii]
MAGVEEVKLVICVLFIPGVFSSYVGCYIDSWNKDLPFQAIEDESMIPDMCIKHCRMSDYFFAAVQNGKLCYCGDTYDRYGSAPQGECSKSCTGDESLTCGGSQRNAIYTTGKPLPTTQTCIINGTEEGVLFENQCFLFVETPKKWHEAQQFCVIRGGNLATVSSRHVQSFLEYQLHGREHADYWIGLHDIRQEGEFIFTDKDIPPGRWDNFNIGQPDNATDGDDCVEMKSSWGYKWNDQLCTTLRNYICQIQLNDIAPPCGDGNEGIRRYGNCYELVEGTSNFENATVECALRNGIPASIDNKDTQRFLRRQVAKTGSTENWYFGLKYSTEREQYEFMDSEKVGNYFKYSDGAQNGEECTVLSRSRNYLWEHSSCSLTENVICQIGAKTAYMLKIDDNAENEFVFTEIVGSLEGNIWLGLENDDMNGSFKWNDGSSLEYTNWISSGLSGIGSCVYLQKLTGEWKDADCSLGWMKTVCEMETPIVFHSS